MVVERVAPRAAEIDAKAEYPWDLRRLFAEHDLFGLPFDTEHGGTGTGTLMLNVAVEEVARACASSARGRLGDEELDHSCSPPTPRWRSPSRRCRCSAATAT